jgi:hypothetical protein
VKVLKAAVHRLVSLIFGCCLLSLLWPINLHTVRTHSLSTVMAAVQFYPHITEYYAPSPSTVNTDPNSDITGGRFGVSTSLFTTCRVFLLCCFRRTINPMNGLTEHKLFSWFSFLLSSFYHAVPSFSHGWTDLVDLDLPSEVPRSQLVGLL